MNCPVCGWMLIDLSSDNYRFIQNGDTVTATYYFYCGQCKKRRTYKEWFRMTDYGFEEEDQNDSGAI